MHKSFFQAALWGMLLAALDLMGCYSPPPVQAQPETIQAMDTLLVARPDAQDLLTLLRGRWQNDADSAYQIQFADSLLQYYYGRNLLRQAQLEIDAACSATSCATDSLALPGWCVLEKDNTGIRCLVVLKCDNLVLQLRALGSANPQLNFKRL